MYRSPESRPSAREYDPLAVALGNASLLGIGYLMMRWRTLAVPAVAVVVGLGYVVNRYQRPWCEYVVLGWWVAVIGHGWWLARWRADRVTRDRQRIVGLAATVVVLLVVGFLRFDVAGIEHRVSDARADGDCGQVLSAHGGSPNPVTTGRSALSSMDSCMACRSRTPAVRSRSPTGCATGGRATTSWTSRPTRPPGSHRPRSPDAATTS